MKILSVELYTKNAGETVSLELILEQSIDYDDDEDQVVIFFVKN